MEEVINNVELWTNLATQLPVAVLFAIFMLRWEQQNNEAVREHHKEWQEWLSEERVKAREERQKNREERNSWREYLHSRDTRHLAAMASLEKQIALQSNILMTLVAASGTDIEKTMETLEKLADETLRKE